MGSNRTWLLFLLLLGLGLLAEGLKEWSHLDSRHAGRLNGGGLSLKDLDVKPFAIDPDSFHRGETTRRGGMRTLGKLDGSGGALPNGLFAGTNAPTAKGAPEAKKEDPKKKKKKNKARRPNPTLPNGVADATLYPESDDDKISSDADNKPSAPTSGAFNPNPKKNDELPITYEDWAALILGRPNKEAVDKMVDFFQTGMVTADIFYSILNAMMEEESDEQHMLAVGAAGAVTHPASFAFLVNTLKAERQGSPVAGQAGENLSAYKTLGNVHYLKGVMTIYLSDASIISYAVRVLDSSTATYITGANNNRVPSAEPRGARVGSQISGFNTTLNGDQVALQKRRLQSAYFGFDQILQHILTVYRNTPEIVEPATRTLERLRTLKTVVGADQAS